jgi:hypothetical protein
MVLKRPPAPGMKEGDDMKKFFSCMEEAKAYAQLFAQVYDQVIQFDLEEKERDIPRWWMGE